MDNSKENCVQKILVGYGVKDGLREMTMAQFRDQVTGRFTQQKVEALRRCEDEQRRDELKRNSFYILPQGRIRENRRQYALGVQPTKENIEYRPDIQMLDLDIRPEGSATAMDCYYTYVNNWLIEQGIAYWPRVAMISVSGKGFHMYTRLSEKMQRMDRKQLIQAFGRVFGLEFDLSTVDPTRRAFQCHEFLTPTDDHYLSLLFGRPLTDEEQRCLDAMDRLMEEAMGQPAIADRKQPATAPCRPEQREGSLTPYRDDTSTQNLQELPDALARYGLDNIARVNRIALGELPLTDVCVAVVKAVCGKEAPVKGERNTVLFESCKHLSYLDGVSVDDLIDAFSSLSFFGLPREEAVGCIRSALKQPQFWELKPSPVLSEAVASFIPKPKSSPLGELEGAPFTPKPKSSPIASQQPLPSALTIPSRLTQCGAMPQLPPLLELIASRVPAHCRESAAQSCFAALGVYLSNEAYIRGLDNSPRRLQFTELLAGETSSGKDYLPRLSEGIMKRRIDHDRQVYEALDNWKEIC